MALARSSAKNNSTANLGFEAKLWLAADKLRSSMDAAEYKHTVLGLIFLEYISDGFEEKHAQLTKELGAGPEDPDEYKAEEVEDDDEPSEEKMPRLVAESAKLESAIRANLKGLGFQ